MNITASIQARMGSKRLPGKVISDICGKPLIIRQVERIKRSRLIDRIIVATSTSNKDNEIVDICRNYNVEYYRGSENDVLDRVASMISSRSIDVHLECYGDSPLIDPNIINEFIGYFIKNYKSNNYISSSIETSYPPGMEVNIYKGDILTEVNELVDKADSLREHVGYNITRYPDRFNIISLKAPHYYNYPNIYLEVDTAKDLELIKIIYNHFINIGNDYFSLDEIIYFLMNNPNLKELNNNVDRRWKAFRKN